METNRPVPTSPGVESKWVLVPEEPSPAEIGLPRSARNGTVRAMAGLAVGAMLLGGVIGGVAMSGVGSDDSPPAANAVAPANNAVAPSATLADTTLSPQQSMLSPDDDGDDDAGEGVDDGED